MSLSAGNGTPIRIKHPLKDNSAMPPGVASDSDKLQLPIFREQQEQEAWCYAASSVMVINFCHPENMVRQCKVAAFVKAPPNGTLECCQTLDDKCALSGCVLSDFSKIFGEFKVKFEDSGDPLDPIIERVTPAKLKSEFKTHKRPVMVIVDWKDQPGSHALVVTGIMEDESKVFILDPLTGAPFGGWQKFNALVLGFGHGVWARTFPGLEKI
jgi:hypothetical protein